MADAHVLHNLQECTDRLTQLEASYQQIDATIRQNMAQLSMLREQLTTAVRDSAAHDVTVPPASRQPIPAGASSLHGTVNEDVTTVPPQPAPLVSGHPAPPEEKTGMGDIPPPPPHPATGPAERDPLQPPAATINEDQYRQREARGQVRTPEERDKDARAEKDAEEQAAAARVKAGDAKDELEAEQQEAEAEKPPAPRTSHGRIRSPDKAKA